MKLNFSFVLFIHFLTKDLNLCLVLLLLPFLLIPGICRTSSMLSSGIKSNTDRLTLPASAVLKAPTLKSSWMLNKQKATRKMWSFIGQSSVRNYTDQDIFISCLREFQIWILWVIHSCLILCFCWQRQQNSKSSSVLWWQMIYRIG